MLYAIAQIEGPCWQYIGEGLVAGVFVLVMLLAVLVGVIGSVVALARRGFHAPTRPLPPPWVLVCDVVVIVPGVIRDLLLRDVSEACGGGQWGGALWGIAIAAWFAFVNMRLLQSPAGAVLWASGTVVLPVVLIIVINLRPESGEPTTDEGERCRWVLDTWGPTVKGVPPEMKDEFRSCVSR